MVEMLVAMAIVVLIGTLAFLAFGNQDQRRKQQALVVPQIVSPQPQKEGRCRGLLLFLGQRRLPVVLGSALSVIVTLGKRAG